MAFRITQGDTSPSIVSTLNDGGVPIDLTNADVRFIMQNKYQEIIIDDNTSGDVNILTAVDGEVEYVFDASDTDTAGTYKAEWEVEYPSGAIETFPTGNKITVEITEEIA